MNNGVHIHDTHIHGVDVASYRFPTDQLEADGTFAWDATEMVVVRLSAGDATGLGYSYTAARPAALLITDKLAPVLRNADPMNIPDLWLRLNQTLRNIGRPGLGLMALAAVDTALWDLKAKLLKVSLTDLWGSARQGVPVYGSGGFTTYSDERLQQQLEGWLEQGLSAVKIKLGTDLREDARRVKLARRVIGENVELMVDTNGAYSPRQALALLPALADQQVTWLEEPVSSDDLEGMRWLRDRAPAGVAIAAGEYGWDAAYFYQMLSSGAVDVLQADATRCGYSGFTRAAHLCEMLQRPLSAHCAPALHAVLCTAVPAFKHLEYFHDHVRLEWTLFDGVPTLREGRLWPDRTRAGHGLTLKCAEAEQYRL